MRNPAAAARRAAKVVRRPPRRASALNSTRRMRKRREKINPLLIGLSAVIPGCKKKDKATILSDAVSYLRELQGKLKALDGGSNNNGGRSCSSAVVDEELRSPLHDAAAHAATRATGNNSAPPPEIEVRISGDNVVVMRIHCKDAKGVLVKMLAEVEGLHLGIMRTNMMLSPASTRIISITAKAEEGFNATADDIVERLRSALHACTNVWKTKYSTDESSSSC